ncbi:hypothetical protein E2986_12500 [Frieseomelitta varia]|uniref:Uncharacterized protein n=2 Tax=Frieseomelitta varia TaxID=561572 RepID=A0A833W426_9HYME|nr:hypothetical protein E2986_12500 [Frieseomelitta varia]
MAHASPLGPFTRQSKRLSNDLFGLAIRVSEFASGNTPSTVAVYNESSPKQVGTLNEQTRKNEKISLKGIKGKGKAMFTTVIFALNTLWMVCEAVPLLDMRNSLEQDALDAIVSCSSNEDCWNWLSVQVHKNVPLISRSQNLPASRMNIRREASNLDPNAIIETWDDNSVTTKQIGNRLSKKDAVMSRSWGAGGMPFSVLYMNPHGPRGNHASTSQQQELGRTESTTPIMHPNKRIALRNGSSTQPKRQYSIIPQFFRSYGWVPFGK